MNSTNTAKKTNARAMPDSPTIERMLYYLKLTRESEWRIENVLYRQGKIVGGVYVGRGQEAIGVGAALTMREGDVTLPCHRDFSVFLIRGFSLADMFANWLGRADSPNRGPRQHDSHRKYEAGDHPHHLAIGRHAAGGLRRGDGFEAARSRETSPWSISAREPPASAMFTKP